MLSKLVYIGLRHRLLYTILIIIGKELKTGAMTFIKFLVFLTVGYTV